jgi:hypothetical protein
MGILLTRKQLSTAETTKALELCVFDVEEARSTRAGTVAFGCLQHGGH